APWLIFCSWGRAVSHTGDANKSKKAGHRCAVTRPSIFSSKPFVFVGAERLLPCDNVAFPPTAQPWRDAYILRKQALSHQLIKRRVGQSRREKYFAAPQ